MSESSRGLVIGAVLCGGRSRRMGRDKATMPGPDGRVLAAVAADALRGAAIADVMFVGGQPAAMRQAGLGPVVADRWPGEGPLGAVVTAWAAAPADAGELAVMACDLPYVTTQAVTAVLAALDPDHDAAVACTSDGRRHPLLAVYRRSSATPMAAAFAAGTRGIGEALARVSVAEVALADDRWAHNANEALDL